MKGGNFRGALIVIAVCAALLIAIALLFPKPPDIGKPEIYILSVDRRVDMDGRDMWVFQYAIGGKVEQAVLPDVGKCHEFEVYLRSVGEIREK